MPDATWETRQNGLKVLSIDGEADIRVGVLSALFSLLRMMRTVAFDCPNAASNINAKTNSSTISIPEALPCKCFDLIVGSGDGGWVAIMLGRLGMSTTEVIETYLRIRTPIHDTYPYNDPQDRWQHNVMGPFFDISLQHLVTSRVESSASQEMIQENPSCFTVALAMHGETDEPRPALFRNYVSRQGNMPNCPIWLAMRAAASSTIFPPADLDSTSQKFVAASQFNFNNPVDVAISEAMELSKKPKISGSPISCLVSLGSGHPGVKPLCDSDLATTTIKLTQSAIGAHGNAYRRFREARDLDHKVYFRLNVEQGLQHDLLARISSGTVLTHTETYLRRPDMNKSIDNAVQCLVEGANGDTKENDSAPVDSMSGRDQRDFRHTSTNAFVSRVQESTPEPLLMKTYINELYTRGYGLPLWNPQPVQKVVEIGDLGFVDQDGSFEALFNITVDPERQPDHAVPPGFVPFKLSGRSIAVKEQAISNPFLESGEMTLSVIEDSSKCWKLRCQIEHGAILIIKDATTKISIRQSYPLVSYIESYYKSWYEFIKEIDTCPREIADRSGLLLVTGIHRNHDWSLGAWMRRSFQHTLSFATLRDVDSNLEIADGWNPKSAPGVRNGPSSQAPSYMPIRDLPQRNIGTQTLFVEGFRIRRRPGKLENLASRMGQVETTSFHTSWTDTLGNMFSSRGTGSGGSPSELPGYPNSPLPPSSGTPGDMNHSKLRYASVEAVETGHFPQHPLDDLADDIFEVLPDAQTVIVHDNDWLKLKDLRETSEGRSFHLQCNLQQSNECAFFAFPPSHLLLRDLGSIIAKEAIRQDVSTAQPLTLTNKLFHSFCNPILYHSVHLATLNALRHFLRTIGSNPALAQLVHYCNIEVDFHASITELQHCSNLSTLAILSNRHDYHKTMQVSLPPSVTYLACDPSYFTSILKPSVPPDSVFQSVTHLYLTHSGITQLWMWLGHACLPALRYLSVGHKITGVGLGDATEDIIPLVKEYLPSTVVVCVLLLWMDTTMDKPLDESTIDLSDGTIDPRVVLGTELSRYSITQTGYLFNVAEAGVKESWTHYKTPTWLWDKAIEVCQQRKREGKYSRSYYQPTRLLARGQSVVALSLDGGGFLALSELYMLKEILERLQSELNLDSAPLPCEVFDVIGGTGSGGIIALLLGRLHLDVDGAIRLFIQFYRSVYRQSRSQRKSKRLKVVSDGFKNLLQSVPDISITDLLLEKEPKCNTFVCASPTDVVGGKPICFRNFLPRQFRTFDCTISKAAQACIAHPRLFPPIKIGPPEAPERFSDASAYGYSNPLEFIMDETESLFKDRERIYLSLGPGEAHMSGWHMGSRVENTSGNGEATNERIGQRISSDSPRFRLSVQHGFQELRRHSWTEPGIILAHTTNYMKTAASEVYINGIINSLVQKCVHNRHEDEGPTVEANRRSSLMHWLVPADNGSSGGASLAPSNPDGAEYIHVQTLHNGPANITTAQGNSVRLRFMLNNYLTPLWRFFFRLVYFLLLFFLILFIAHEVALWHNSLPAVALILDSGDECPQLQRHAS